MLERVDAEALLHRLVQAPADVVMAAQIIHEPAVFGQRVELVDLVLSRRTSRLASALHRLTMMETLYSMWHSGGLGRPK